MRFGVPLGLLHPDAWKDVAVAADELGFESVWLPEHLVFATDLSLAVYPGTDKPGISPGTPLFDAPAYLCWLAGLTSRVRLGTAVHLYALRHPFVSARAFATLDRVSGGRAVCGVGAGWYEGEWRAAGVDFATRGPRLDEAIEVTRRLWSEPVVAHTGRFYSFPEVAFEPKPVQERLPILAGGESDAALRRAVRLCDGWISMPHSLGSLRPRLDRLAALRAGAPGDRPFSVTVHAYELSGPAEVPEWERLGVDRMIVRPWRRRRDAVTALAAFASEYFP
ncbi:TIGR03619 family F420-dependent LLM class oxidoreductase [Planomonospora sp. ID67723]|uniref:TIGR03619 family F420-dependent LLM class oxidoreductase n=1 Tax=Planomonospora sp. ID67723 TaxID=2738134 RepID=UPI0018C37E47|nr:TIGR03619 family F420-dependent LLM class oxidoreductase [Planomonospora sp. ID67723]MBG0828683.1 TIGR03619 family F420-dependent LLM class oxidoreductase [Planomonospora sp. ID67723]